jgi:hypothetical protein
LTKASPAQKITTKAEISQPLQARANVRAYLNPERRYFWADRPLVKAELEWDKVALVLVDGRRNETMGILPVEAASDPKW